MNDFLKNRHNYRTAKSPLKTRKIYLNKHGERVRYDSELGLLTYVTWADKPNPDGPFQCCFLYEKITHPQRVYPYTVETFDKLGLYLWVDPTSKEALQLLTSERMNALCGYALPRGCKIYTYPDPAVPGCVAVLIEGKGDDDTYGLLFAAGSVEPDEVEFTSWPPVSGSLKFF